MIERKHGTVGRYTPAARVNHWLNAIILILLALSGMSLFHPALFFLTDLFGGGQKQHGRSLPTERGWLSHCRIAEKSLASFSSIVRTTRLASTGKPSICCAPPGVKLPVISPKSARQRYCAIPNC